MTSKPSASDKGYVVGGLSAFPVALDDQSFGSANDAETQLAAAVNWSSTQISVVDGSKFPHVNGVLRINNEMIFYARRRDNIFDQLFRGFGQSYPASHRAGTTVTAPCIADMNNTLRDGLVKLQAKVGLPDDKPSIESGATLRSRVAFLRRKWFTPKANFLTMNRVGYAPLGVQFRDVSIGEPVRWLWEFGDGTTSTQQHPFHEYKEPGTYDVGLTIFTSSDVSDQNGVAAKLKHGYVNVIDNENINDVLFYTRNLSDQVNNLALQGVRPLRMLFVDQTRGNITTRIWSFGDGTIVTVEDPNQFQIEHVYDRTGFFIPSLTVSDGKKTIRRNLDAQIEVIVA